MGGCTSVTVFVTSAIFFLGICFYLIEMTVDLKERVKRIDKKPPLNKNDLEQTSTSIFPTSAQRSMRIIQAIRFHNEIIEYGHFAGKIENLTKMIKCFSFGRIAHMVKDIMSAVLFYQLLMCAGIVSLNLFSMISNGVRTDSQLIIPCYEISMSLLPTFVYCYASDMVTEKLLKVGDAFFYECAWHTTPMEQQRLLAFTIQCAHQHAFSFDGFGLVQCTLGTFLSVNMHES